jgi:hypothetical protein
MAGSDGFVQGLSVAMIMKNAERCSSVAAGWK